MKQLMQVQNLLLLLQVQMQMKISKEIKQMTKLQIVFNEKWKEGMASGIVAGVQESNHVKQ